MLTSFRRILPAAAGTKVRATKRLASSEKATVRAMSVKSWRVMPSVKKMGTKTTMVVMVEAVMAPAICFAPSTAAVLASFPIERIRKTFSITTMELSTSMPTLSARPDMEMMFRLIPAKYMHTKAVMTLMTMESPTITVGLMLLRNIKRIRMASRPPMSRFLMMVSIIMWTYSPWSIRTV